MSSILDPYGSPVATGLFESAQNEYGIRPYWPTQDRDFDQNISSHGISKIRSDAQRLFANNGLIQAACGDKATYAVGRSWLPEFRGADAEWGKAAKDWLVEQWYPICDVAGTDFQTSLYLESLAVDHSGDYFLLLTEHEEGFPAQQLLPANRIGSRDFNNPAVTPSGKLQSGPYAGLTFINGVVKNPFGRPVAFHVLADDPAQDRFVSARDMMQIGDAQWFSQSRYLPSITPGILDLRDAMATKGYEKQAHMLASTIGLLEYNDTGDVDELDPRNRLNRATSADGTKAIVSQINDGGQTRYYRGNSGNKLEAFQFSRPGEGFERLMDRLERASLTAMWPYELVWKPSELGGVNGRMVMARAKRFVADRQDLLAPSAKRRVGYAIAKAIKLGILKPSADWWKWSFTFPADITADYGREAQSDREDYKLGIKNLSAIVGSNGGELSAHLAERERELMAIIESAQRIATSTGIGFDTALSLVQQRSSSGNMPGGLQGTPLDQTQNDV
jgi:hypothetical protein